MWFSSRRSDSDARLDGKVAVITGANCGIGKETALDFVRRGARVVIACRDLKKAERAADDIRRDTSEVKDAGHVVVARLDLSSLASVRQCAQHLLQTEHSVNILVNNAGVCYYPKAYTENGFEMHIGVNHLGHFLFTCLLLPRIIRSAPARIITVSSYKNCLAEGICLNDLHWERRPYSAFDAYSESKLANILFSVELARRLKGLGVTTYAVHPGVVATEAARYANDSFFSGAQWLFENVLIYFIKTPRQGAQTTIHCAVSEEAGGETGLYYRDCKKGRPNPLAFNTKLAVDLWDKSARLVGMRSWDPFTAWDTTSRILCEDSKGSRQL
ncbi:retinol dehydrogenase 12-like [Zootermopsis nevadensis]|uniref:Retinol dehydrogenase 12 n=1 Tax=Zootermopsis nevadensis TaxID=136037 RepID=A0A067QZM7_ZOONE|nr:retinol dehydrogenase 12-like [Zootermopsis nevadensis]XP_021933911.1 retinol dehydrogenase 12-like [Zootermopsis nevadensis]XP_021933912.1 retinol dehydrogenase 12-like [Zootermopsis nevadensis]KDR11839.1 Retinol dehydrogenase 12 [Zootermopsis nevadensis]